MSATSLIFIWCESIRFPVASNVLLIRDKHLFTTCLYALYCSFC